MGIKSLYIYIFLILMCINSVVVRAQKEKTADDLVNEFAATLDSFPNKKTNHANFVQKKKEALVFRNSVYDSIQFDRQLRQYDFAAMHQNRCFTWQYYSSVFIFIMVIVIVGMGLVLSYKQFQLSEVQVKANIMKPKSETTTVEAENTNIEISQAGLKINTGVIGLAILFLSLAFFFLYLKYVYQIEIIETENKSLLLK